LARLRHVFQILQRNRHVFGIAMAVQDRVSSAIAFNKNGWNTFVFQSYKLNETRMLLQIVRSPVRIREGKGNRRDDSTAHPFLSKTSRFFSKKLFFENKLF
jgi:hypothetical protein